MKHASYFEGTLQLRNCEKEVYKFVDEYFIENNVGVARKIKQKKGFDFFVSSNKFLLRLKSVLLRHFSGRVLVSRKLFSRDRQTSKEIFRMTLLFEQLSFDVGDIIDDRGDQVRVLRIGERINVKNLKTGKSYFMRF